MRGFARARHEADAPSAPRASSPPFFFVRHGETDWNREGRLQGQRDIPLNARGRDQAAAAGRTLRRVIADQGFVPADLDFVASPLGRTRETMTLLRSALGAHEPDRFRIDARLLELTFGDWEGETWAGLKLSDPARFSERRRDKWAFEPPGGESYAALCDRVAPWLASVRHHAIVVAHGGVARALLHLLTGLDPRRAPSTEIWQGRVLRFGDRTADWI